MVKSRNRGNERADKCDDLQGEPERRDGSEGSEEITNVRER